MHSGTTHWSVFTVLILAVCVTLSLAQNTATSAKPESQAATDSGDCLGTVARRTKAQKSAHATKVVTDDDVSASNGPLPRLKINDAENGEDVVAAVADYKKNHTPAQTEEALHRWYNECDEELAAAIKENIEIKNLRETNAAQGYELCQSHDYEKCETCRRAEISGARRDQTEMKSQ